MYRLGVTVRTDRLGESRGIELIPDNTGNVAPSTLTMPLCSTRYYLYNYYSYIQLIYTLDTTYISSTA